MLCNNACFQAEVFSHKRRTAAQVLGETTISSPCSPAICAFAANAIPTSRRRPSTRRDLTGSNLWPGKSGCIATLPIPANVQTRAAPKRRGVGLRARSGVEAALRPPRRRPGTRRDLTGSNLWPGKSGCIATLPIPANVQTRAAPKRRGVGLRARSGVNAAQPPGCVREAVWMPHCGYSAFMWAGGQMMARALPTMSVTGPTSAEWLSCEMARLSPRRKYSPSPSTVSG